MTPRAIAEPAVNDLLARLLPPLADLRVRLAWRDRDGGEEARQVSMAALGLQPIDLLHLVQLGGQPMAELDERLLRHVATEAALPPDLVPGVMIEYTQRLPGLVTFFETAPLIGHLRNLLTRSRPLRTTDVMPTLEATREEDDAGARANRARPAAVLAALEAWRTEAEALVAEIDALLGGGAAGQETILEDIDDLVDRTIAILERAARFGLPATGWGDILDRRLAALTALLASLDTVIARWQRRLAEAAAALAADASLPSNATTEERSSFLILAESAVSTEQTTPLPADADDYLAAVTTKRNAFSVQLEGLQAVRPAAATLSVALAAASVLLPLDAFDATPFDLVPVEEQVVALARHLRERAAAAVAEAGARITAARARFDAHDAATPGRARAEAAIAASKALLGEGAVVVPEFDLPAEVGEEWEAAIAWSRTGQLTAHLAGRRPPVEDWLNGVARVREKMRDWEQAALLAGVLGRSEPGLLPIQLPHRAEPWLALDVPPGFAADGERILYTAHYPVAFGRRRPVCGLLLDEWTETIPSDDIAAGLAFHYDSPDCEAPQAMLLMVPPQPVETWRWEDIVDTLHETLGLARLRAVEPSQLDGTPFASFLPATVMAATVHGTSIAANLALNNRVLRAMGGPDA